MKRRFPLPAALMSGLFAPSVFFAMKASAAPPDSPPALSETTAKPEPMKPGAAPAAGTRSSAAPRPPAPVWESVPLPKQLRFQIPFAARKAPADRPAHPFLRGVVQCFPSAIPSHLATGGLRFETTGEIDLYLLIGDEPNMPPPRDAPTLEVVREKLLFRGWFPLGEVNVASSRNGRSASKRMTLYYRRFGAGERFEIVTNDLRTPPLFAAEPGADSPDFERIEPSTRMTEANQRDQVGAKMRHLLESGRFDALERWLQDSLRENRTFPSGATMFSATRRQFDGRYNRYVSVEFLDGPRRSAEAWLKQHPDSIPARLATADILIEWADELEESAAADRRVDEIDEARRRALELLYEVETKDAKIVDVYASLVRLARLQRWDIEIIEGYVDRMLDSGTWCPRALGDALRYCLYRWGDDEGGYAKVTAVHERIDSRSRERFGHALYAACLTEQPYDPPDRPFRWLDADWKRMREGFETWTKMRPDSRLVRLWYLRYAFLKADHATAARLFQELGDFAASDEGVFPDEAELRRARTWAVADMVKGEQFALESPSCYLPSKIRWRGSDDLLVCGDRRGVVHLLSLEKSAPYRYFTVESAGREREYAFSADGRAAAAFSDREIVVVHDDGRRRTRFYPPEESRISHVAISPDGRTLLASDPARAQMLSFQLDGDDRTAAAKPARCEGHMVFPSFLEFVDDSTAIVIHHDEVLRFSRHTGRFESVAELPERITLAALSADRRRLAVYALTKLRILDTADGSTTIEASSNPLSSLAFSPDGRTLAGGEKRFSRDDPKVRFWNVADLKPLGSFQGHRDDVTTLAFSPDGRRLASGAADLTYRFWNVPKAETEK